MTNTDKILADMIAHAKTGADVYPFMFQPLMGRSNAVSAAIRKAKSTGALVEAGRDGTGKPFYRVPLPAPTHQANEAKH